MVDTIKFLDPVKGLVDYVNDIKPYHTKVIESLVEYVGNETVNVRVGEGFNIDTELFFSVTNPFCECYTVPIDGQTVINTTIQTTTNIKFVGSPPQQVYDFYGTVVYLNGVLQKEITTLTPDGDYIISGNSQITFVDPPAIPPDSAVPKLKQGDNVKICTGTQDQTFLGGCDNNGFGALPYGDPENILVLSPDPSETVADFPAMTSNSFIVLGDQKDLFDSTDNLVLNLSSSIEARIIDITLPTGSPLTGGAFTVLGIHPSKYLDGQVFSIKGSYFNDTSYSITGNSTSSGGTTTISVEGQNIISDDISGFVSRVDTLNTGEFSVTGVIFTEDRGTLVSYTTVFIAGLTLTPPTDIIDNERYVATITSTGLEYTKILSYSNALKYYELSPPSLTHTSDEGIIQTPILEISQTSPAYFVVEGSYVGSNLFIGDTFDVINSTDNNGTYTITSIDYVPADVIGSPALPERTQFGVESIHDSNIDGLVQLDIPSNVFIINNDYTDFFKQGSRLTAITGSVSGDYTVLYSKFINNETRIRVLEDLITGDGPLIIGTTSNAFIIDGNHTATYRPGVLFNVVNSLRNDGQYTVFTGSPSSVYDPLTHTTNIPVYETFDTTDTTGELHEFANGALKIRNTGYGETAPMCDVVPETMVVVNIKDKLYIDNIGIWARDDIIAHGINNMGWGYDLPSLTIFSPTEPADPTISDTTPIGPSENDLWFDIAPNTDNPSAPGILKQYVQVLAGSPPSVIGSPPTLEWIEVPNNKAYWVDTNTNYMYYRMIYQYYDNSGSSYITPIDTDWVLEYTKIPGYNDHLVGNGTREQQGFETFFATESSTSVAETTFTFSATGSPPLTIPETPVGSPSVLTPNPLMLEVYVNSTIAEVNILSTTSFDVISPRLRVGDFVEARVFDDTAIPSGVWVGGYDANAAIVETFDMVLGYKFKIKGTDLLNNAIQLYTTNLDTFMVGSPPSPILGDVEIINSVGSPNNDGIYTITAVSGGTGSPPSDIVLTVTGSLLDSGIFGGSPLIESGDLLYQQWFQYIIVNTTANTILVVGDATNDIQDGALIQISYSNNIGSPSINNNGTYTVNGTPIYDGRNTTITITGTIPNIGNSGGWVESI